MTPADVNLAKGQGPSHVQGGYGDAFLLGTQILADKPNLLNTYFQRNGRKMTTLRKLGLLFPGRLNTKPSSSPTTSHYEKVRWKNTVQILSIASGTAANEAVLTLDPSEVVTDTVSETNQTYTTSRPRKGETLQAVAGGVRYRIIDKPAVNQIVIKAFDNTDPASEISGGQTVFIGASIKGEGTGQIKPLRARRVRYENTFWITDDTDAVTGTHMTTKVAFTPVPGSNSLWLEGLEDMEMRAEWAKGDIWLNGQQSTGNNLEEYSQILEENVSMLGTQGLIPYIQQMGQEFYYDPNDWTEDDMYALAEYYHDINLGTGRVILLQGYGINRTIEKSMGSKLNYDWVMGVSDQYIKESQRVNWADPISREYNPKGAFVNLGIQGFALGQFEFLQTAIPEFNDGDGLGAIGYRDWMIAAPFGLANVEGNDSIPYLGYEYRGSDGYSRELELWVQSGAGTARVVTSAADVPSVNYGKTSEYDGNRYFVRSEIAPHFALGEQFALFMPQGVSS